MWKTETVLVHSARITQSSVGVPLSVSWGRFIGTGLERRSGRRPRRTSVRAYSFCRQYFPLLLTLRSNEIGSKRVSIWRHRANDCASRAADWLTHGKSPFLGSPKYQSGLLWRADHGLAGTRMEAAGNALKYQARAEARSCLVLSRGVPCSKTALPATKI